MSHSEKNTGDLFRDGLWRDNPALVMLLGLCPLLAVSNSAINGLALGLATLLTVCVTNFLVSLFRHHIESGIRIPIYVLIIATTVTTIEFLTRAYFPGLYQSLGIFLPLIVTNCLILGRAEAFASRNSPLPALIDGLSMGHLLFNLSAPATGIQFFNEDKGVLLALLPPGAFIGFGLLIAVSNWINVKRRSKQFVVQSKIS